MSTGIDRMTSTTCLCKLYVIKQIKKVQPTTLWKRSTYPIEFDHIDIIRPFPITGFDCSWYWVTFLDDYTQKSEVILIANQNNVPKEFQ